MSIKQTKQSPKIDTLIQQATDHPGIPLDQREVLRRDLLDHFEEGLAAGQSVDQLVRSFGDPIEAARRIAMVCADEADTKAATSDVIAGFSTSKRGSSLASILWHELGTSLRNLMRSPGFSAVVMLTLALGIGANTAVFSVLDTVLIKPLPYPNPQELVTVQETWRDNPPSFAYTRAPTNAELSTWEDVFSGVATIYTYRETGADLVSDDGSTRLITSYVSASFFETLGAAPLLGRTFFKDESLGPGQRGDDTERPRVAVLSHELWRKQFGADSAVLGRSIELDGNLTEVVGVMPRGFSNPMGSKADLWIPQDLRLGGSNNWGNYYLNTIARLRTGVSIEQAAIMTDSLIAGVREQQPDSGEWGIALTHLQSDIVGKARRTMLLILAAAAALVLLSACVNVGNLVFARGINREREIALRGALGSARERLMSLLILENAWLALGGSALGLVLGLGGVKVLLAAAPDALPQTTTQPGLSAAVFFAGMAAMVTSLLIFGIGPSLILARVPLAKALSGRGRGGTESRRLRRLRSLFVVAQVTVALVLLIGAGLLMRSFAEIRDAPLGVAPKQALTFEVHLPTARYATGTQRIDFHDQFQERVSGLPGVTAVGAVSWLPLNGRYHTWGLAQAQEAAEDHESEAEFSPTDVRVMAGDYFAAAGLQLLKGRPPSRADQTGEPVIWLSRTAAEKTFADQDPVGLSVTTSGRPWEVAGVVTDVAVDARGTTFPTVYIPHRQFADDRNWPLTQIVRAEADVDLLRYTAAQELKAVDPGLVLFRPRLFEGYIDVARAQDRFVLLLMSVFAVLALGLVTVGTYGVLAGNVARRRREIGIRMALGADHRAVHWAIVRGAVILVAVGIAAGAGISLAGSRWLSSMLFGVSSTDAATYIAACFLLLAMGVGASLLPALRATRVDPARTLSES